MQKTNHPLEQMSAEIENRGLMVFDEVTQMPIYGEPYVSPYLTITLNHSGRVLLEYDLQTVEFRPHELSVVMPDHVITAIETSEDYKCTLIAISREFFEKMRYSVTFQPDVNYHVSPCIQLDDNQYAAICQFTQLLAHVSNLDIAATPVMCTNLIDVLAHLLIEYRNQHPMSITSISSAQLLFERFYDLLTTHYRKSREVRYYANLLCLSPKYFGTVIRQSTGTGAGEWIVRYVVIQAKSMLRYRRDLTIQQVSHNLGFPDQTAFARYFKANTGLSPKEYREQI